MDISSMLEVQVNEVKEVDSKENLTPKDLLPSTTNTPASISQDETNYYKLLFGYDISAVRFQRLHCTACDAHIGSAPVDSSNMFEHPVLHTLLCSTCREFYGDGTFEQGDDATDMFCRWCANGGNLYCCSFCSNTFCYKCIKRNIDPVLRKKIEADEKWKCFVCDPTDLYPARATCWALLEYIQRMNRLLQNNCKLTQQKIDEKMNLDETKCCPRKRRQKRRRTGSNSEEEDETYTPKQIVPTVVRRKKRGRKPKYNGLDSSVSNMSHSGASEESSMDHSELLPSLLSCEQTMVECENTTIDTDDIVVTQPPPKSLPARVEPPVVQQPIFNTIMNVVASPNFLQSVSTGMPLRHVPGGLSQVSLYQAMHCAQTPMVTIPNQSASMLNQPRFPRSELQRPLAISTPNVIEIESDSEDVAVIGPSRNSRSFKDHVGNNKAVPVALVSSKNTYIIPKKPEMLEKRSCKTLNQRLLPHGQEIDNVLTSLKTKLQGVFDSWKQEESKKHELNGARVMIKHFHHDIRDTVAQLACINDRVVREYNRWKRLQIKTGATQSSDSNHASDKVKSEELPLDMICVNDSDSDPDSESENVAISPSEFVGSTNVVDGMKSFRKRSTVTRAVGEDRAFLVDKSVQIYDVELRDYDKCIRHSTMKVSDHVKAQGNPSTSCASEQRQHPEKYEEQFIYFLQTRTLPEGSQEEESKDLPDPNETPLKDLIEANSPFISEMLETMDTSVSNNVSDLNSSTKEDSDSKSPAGQVTNSVKSQQADEFDEMVSNINDAINSKKTKGPEEQFSTSDDIHVVNTLKNAKQDSGRSKRITRNSANSHGDDCTITNN